MSKLEEILRNLIKTMSEYNTLNYGGCCVFATEVAHRLYEKGYYVSIRLEDYHNDCNININSIRLNKKVLKKNNPAKTYYANNVSLKHVLLEIQIDSNRKYFDSEGIYDKSNYDNILLGRLTLEEARKMANYGGNWNRQFDRELIPDIIYKINTIIENLPTID